MTRIAKTGDLGIGAAIDLCVAIEADYAERKRKAVARLGAELAEKLATIRTRVPPELRGRFDALREADMDRRANEAEMPKCEGCSKPIDTDGGETYGLDDEGIYLCSDCMDEPSHEQTTVDGLGGDIASTSGSVDAPTTAAAPEPPWFNDEPETTLEPKRIECTADEMPEIDP